MHHPDFADSGISLIYKPAFDDAVRAASDAAMPGDVVVVKPSHSSGDSPEGKIVAIGFSTE